MYKILLKLKNNNTDCCLLQGSHTSGKMGKTWEFYSTRSRPGNALENREKQQKLGETLNFFYWKLLTLTSQYHIFGNHCYSKYP
jgi:hypothetical protein